MSIVAVRAVSTGVAVAVRAACLRATGVDARTVTVIESHRAEYRTGALDRTGTSYAQDTVESSLDLTGEGWAVYTRAGRHHSASAIMVKAFDPAAAKFMCNCGAVNHLWDQPIDLDTLAVSWETA